MKLEKYRQWRYCILFLLLVFNYGCASKQKIHGLVGGAPGSHKVTEVTYVASREEILNAEGLHKHLMSAGVDSANLKNGSVVIGRVYCCGGSGTAETENNVAVYVPSKLNIEINDVLEFVEGYGPDGDNIMQLNVAFKVRHKNGVREGICKWDPENPKLWFRVLKCPWMENEGWEKGRALHPEWFKLTST